MEIQIFANEKFGKVRTMNKDGEAWFVGKDVAQVLGYKDASNAVFNNVDDDDKTTLVIHQSGSGYKTKTTFINESGLFSLILSSKLPQAKEFKHWVTSEVLPQIRRTGGYIPVSEGDDEKMLLAKAIMIMNRTISELQPQAEYAKQVLLSPTCYTMTQVAKSMSMTAQELTARLKDMRIVYRSASGPLMLYADYLKNGYEAYRTKKGEDIFGNVTWTDTYLVWTERGKEWLHRVVNN